MFYRLPVIFILSLSKGLFILFKERLPLLVFSPRAPETSSGQVLAGRHQQQMYSFYLLVTHRRADAKHQQGRNVAPQFSEPLIA